MIPSCDQVATPFGFDGFTHLISSTAPLSASLMSLRTWARVSPRQSPSSATIRSIFFAASVDMTCISAHRVTSREVADMGDRIDSLEDALAAVARVGPTAREHAQKAEDGRAL